MQLESARFSLNDSREKPIHQWQEDFLFLAGAEPPSSFSVLYVAHSKMLACTYEWTLNQSAPLALQEGSSQL